MIEFLKSLWQQAKKILVPKSYFSWQVVLYLSLFSWLMSWVAVSLGALSITILLLASFSWIFLALGVGWAIADSKFKVFGTPIAPAAPWVAGAILCIFLFGSWEENLVAPGLISWPLVSFGLIAVPQLFNWELKYKGAKPDVRQELALVLLVSILASSWFGFYFRIQDWLRLYPSLLTDSFENSGFVYRVPGEQTAVSEGVSLLTLAESAIQEQLSQRPWSWVERWLLNLDDQMDDIRREVRDRLDPNSAEYPLWELRAKTDARSNGYTLRLRAIWLGPAADPEGYYHEKECRLMPRVQQTRPSASAEAPSANPVVLASFSCDLATPRRPGRPD